MIAAPIHDPVETDALLQKAAAGDRTSWGMLLDQNRERLRRMVALRMDHRLQGRLDPSDVIQESYLEASQRLAEYIAQPTLPFYLWLRAIGREVQQDFGGVPAASSVALAGQFASHDLRPSEIAVRDEVRQRIQSLLEQLDPMDREILALRHYEQLNNGEAAKVLDLQESAASKRYLRAIQRLKDVMTNEFDSSSAPPP
jgi:RNA polymerase sigma-70 factor (ECF subfamily)